MLAIFAARSIAVPLAPAFPIPELQYILNHSEASLLVSSSKFGSKAIDVLATELPAKPAFLQLEKHCGGSPRDEVVLEETCPEKEGMMLYTSGTTSRPVSK
jgi:acyl-CoA synthetase (AMP-forming)/AMP-acid ligase II